MHGKYYFVKKFSIENLYPQIFETSFTSIKTDIGDGSTDCYVVEVLDSDVGALNVKFNKTQGNSMYIRSANDLSISTHEIYSGVTGNQNPENVKIVSVPTKVKHSEILEKFIKSFIHYGCIIVKHFKNESVAFKDKNSEDSPYDDSDYTITNQDVFLLFNEKLNTKICIEVVRRPKELVTLFYGEHIHEDMFCKFKEDIIVPLKNIVNKTEGKFHMITQNKYGFDLDEMEIDTKVDETTISRNYNDDFTAVNDTILNSINNKKRGLILLHGKPGTGKTSYIKQLIAMEKDRKLVYIPPHLTNILADPTFISFVRTDLANHVLIIEDAERVLYARDSGRSQEGAVSNILNVTDGILGDALNMLIIATFNTDIQELDSALLRKGRLIAQYKFDKLSEDKSKAIVSEVYGKDSGVTVNGPMTLAEIYNFDVVVHRPTETEKPTFGFIPE